MVTVPSGGDVTCTIHNTAQQPHLTLIKTVTNDDGGTAEPTDWTLTADGPTTGISGPVDDAAVTDVPVAIGDYDLSESGGPDSYNASAWSCDGGTLEGSKVTVALGEDVTCTINNDDIAPVWRLAKTSDPATGETVNPGDTISYTVTATKVSGVDPTDLTVTDDLSNVLNNATLVDGPTASTGTAVVSGNTMTWTIPTLSDTETVTYTVRVNADAYGVTLANVVTGSGSETCPAPGDETLAVQAAAVTAAADDDQCDTVHYTPEWELTKTSDPAPGSTVQPGSTITYTLTATNTSDNATLSGATATDDLSDVLKHGTLVSVPADATLDGTTLTWQIPDLAPGESATLMYQVRLDDDAWNVTVTNVATPGNGGECPPAECTTDHKTPPKPHEPNQPNLPNTGGPALATVGLGLALLVGGGGLMLWSRRRKAD